MLEKKDNYIEVGNIIFEFDEKGELIKTYNNVYEFLYVKLNDKEKEIILESYNTIIKCLDKSFGRYEKNKEVKNNVSKTENINNTVEKIVGPKKIISFGLDKKENGKVEPTFTIHNAILDVLTEEERNIIINALFELLKFKLLINDKIRNNATEEERLDICYAFILSFAGILSGEKENSFDIEKV